MSVIEGKVALITGGASGIGLAIAKEFLNNKSSGITIIDVNEELGRKVTEELAGKYGNEKIIFIKADVANREEFEEAFITTVNKFNQLDIVVNNAGIVDEFLWEKTLGINLGGAMTGTYLAMQKYLPKYRAGDEGIVVNVSSSLGLVINPVSPIYCTCKTGIVTLGRTLGTDPYYKASRTRILTICPAGVETNLANTRKLALKDIPNNLPSLEERMKPERIGQELIKIMDVGRNGSVWLIEKEKTHQVEIPDLRKFVTQTL